MPSWTGPLPTPENMVVVDVASDWEASELLASFSHIHGLHCLQLTSKLTEQRNCDVIKTQETYLLSDLLGHFEKLRQTLGPLQSFQSPTTQRILYFGNGSNFEVHKAKEYLKEKLVKPSPDSVVVLVHGSLSEGPRIDTPIGKLSSTEVALNMVANATTGASLRVPSLGVQFALSAATTLLTGWILYSYPITFTLLLSSLIAALLFVMGLITFHYDIQVPVVAGLVSIVTTYLLGMSDRLDKRERREWEIEQESDNLKRLDELRNNFLSLVSHDLKTPIAKMQGGLERVIRNDFGILNPAQREAVEKILSANGDLQRTISLLLLLSRIESRDFLLKKAPTDLSELIEKSVRANEQLASDRDIEVQLELEPLFLVELDAALIREVISNLIDNAIKYSPTRTHITVRCGELENCPELSPPQPAVWFEVQDEGPGIRKEDRKAVLQKFNRGGLENTAADLSVQGSGLGLYLVSFFVERHGGVLEVISRTQGEEIPAGDIRAEYFSGEKTGTVMRVALPIDSLDGET